jgi:uncharacterized membrane protein YgaE (UPF0421/DUF939 family)
MANFKFNILYALKCVIGVSICYMLYELWPQYPFNWALVSVVLALSPDNSNKQAINRIIANVLGCGVGILLFPLPIPNLAAILIGVVLVIALGERLNLSETIRTALSALLIVTLQEYKLKIWYIPLERVLCVMTGCIVAVLLTFLFNFLVFKLKRV